jgi:acetamidase/formamidase
VAPALRIISGDTVRTWSLDAAGRDSTGAARSRGGNPLTGPFYVEGAMPGDVLAVRLHRVRLNRDDAFAGGGVVWNALTPGYVRDYKDVTFNSRWRLDRVRGLATLAQPTPALRALALPVRPMLGGIGVAPPGAQVIRTTDSGQFGGNMDYNALREGATVYLPVFQRGALLFVGDGHALQGDGELTGDALETSMDIEFSVDLLRRRRSFTPRAEDDEFLMAIGISGDLTDALRHATTELSRWLERDYQLSAPELASLLGVSMRYDVADLVGTQVSIVAKMPKAALRQIQQASQ